MNNYSITKGAVNQSVVLRFLDDTDGTPETGVTHATTGLILYYRREGAANVSMATLTTLAALTTAHNDKGIKHIGAGEVRVDVPDAAFATGVDGVLIHGVATGMVVISAYCQLTGVDLKDGVRGGMTALPAVVPGAPNGMFIAGTNAATVVTTSFTTTFTGNVTGSVASVTGNVDGNVTGSVGSLTGHTVQTGDSFARIGAAGALLTDLGGMSIAMKAEVNAEADTAISDAALATAVDVAAVQATVDAIETTIGVAGVGLTAVPWNAAWDAEVESEVNDALNTAIAELPVATPSATPSLRTAIMLLYMPLRNQLVAQTSGTDALEIYNDAGTMVASKLLSDVGGDYTEAKMT